MQSSTSTRSIPPLFRHLILPALGLVFCGAMAWGGTAGNWTTIPTQIIRPVARTGHSLASFDGGALLYGGRTPTMSGSTALSDLWEYQASTGKFSRLNSTTPLPPARSGHAAVASGIFMNMFFGAAENGSLLQDVWEYDDFRHCWEPRLPASGQRPAARKEHTAVVLAANQYLIFGGRGGDGSVLQADLWSYQSLSRTWTQLADLPNGGRYGHAAVPLGGRMYVLGGTSADGAQNDVWAYNPGLNSWAQLTSDGDLPGRFTGSAAAAGDFGSGVGPQILLVGGQDESGSDLGSTYSISVDPVNQLAHWSRLPDHTHVFQPTAAAIARPAGQGAAVNLLLFGGSTAGVSRDQASIYSTYVAPPPGADLAPTWVTQKRTSKGSGSRILWTLSGSVKVNSQGTTKAGATSMRLVLSADTTADASDVLLKQVKVGALSPGKSKTVKWSAKLPTGQTGNGQYVIATVDALEQVAESSEMNNALASALF